MRHASRLVPLCTPQTSIHPHPHPGLPPAITRTTHVQESHEDGPASHNVTGFGYAMADEPGTKPRKVGAKGGELLAVACI